VTPVTTDYHDILILGVFLLDPLDDCFAILINRKVVWVCVDSEHGSGDLVFVMLCLGRLWYVHCG
jgi:hypothetical protein